eukprot:scaffold1211_cov337-Prasinococcus_capsulatus_cf.AAC.7
MTAPSNFMRITVRICDVPSTGIECAVTLLGKPAASSAPFTWRQQGGGDRRHGALRQGGRMRSLCDTGRHTHPEGTTDLKRGVLSQRRMPRTTTDHSPWV